MASEEPKICRCGRRRYTTEDLERWRREFPNGPTAPEPEWARIICWSTSDSCGRRPLRGPDEAPVSNIYDKEK